MNHPKEILSFPPVSRVRRNHALEHATLNVLAQEGFQGRLAGYSDLEGFWVMGEVPTERLQDALKKAQARLRAGESRLAIHANCGTNFVVAGTAAGAAAWLGMAGVGEGWRKRLERLPLMITLATAALVLTQPLGFILQKNVTTEAELGNLEVTEITLYQRSETPLHRVKTKG